MTMMTGCKFALAVLLLSLALPAYAQTDTATITGTVTDPSGASVVGASIKATNRATGLDYTTGSNEAGIYVLTAIPPGA